MTACISHVVDHVVCARWPENWTMLRFHERQPLIGMGRIHCEYLVLAYTCDFTKVLPDICYNYPKMNKNAEGEKNQDLKSRLEAQS